jgi:hypothetical protein
MKRMETQKTIPNNFRKTIDVVENKIIKIKLKNKKIRNLFSQKWKRRY